MESLKGSMVSMWTFEVLGQYIKCINVKHSAISSSGLLRTCQTYKIALFAKILAAVNYFQKKTPSLMLTRLCLRL